MTVERNLDERGIGDAAANNDSVVGGGAGDRQIIAIGRTGERSARREGFSFQRRPAVIGPHALNGTVSHGQAVVIAEIVAPQYDRRLRFSRSELLVVDVGQSRIDARGQFHVYFVVPGGRVA